MSAEYVLSQGLIVILSGNWPAAGGWERLAKKVKLRSPEAQGTSGSLFNKEGLAGVSVRCNKPCF